VKFARGNLGKGEKGGVTDTGVSLEENIWCEKCSREQFRLANPAETRLGVEEIRGFSMAGGCPNVIACQKRLVKRKSEPGRIIPIVLVAQRRGGK